MLFNETDIEELGENSTNVGEVIHLTADGLILRSETNGEKYFKYIENPQHYEIGFYETIGDAVPFSAMDKAYADKINSTITN